MNLVKAYKYSSKGRFSFNYWLGEGLKGFGRTYKGLVSFMTGLG